MGKEIERKFLIAPEVDPAAWKAGPPGTLMRQGYLSTVPDRTVRVRTAGERAMLTIKGKTEGATRREYEYEIPRADANEMLDELCERPLIEKTRRVRNVGGHDWEIDEFHGDNEGLLLAEIELTDEQESFVRPTWIGEEVTTDPRYYNAQLVHRPFSRWKE